MTALIVAFKAVILIALSIGAFAALAVLVGFDPAIGGEVSGCKVEPSPICLVTIF